MDLRQWRISRGLTQGALAKKLGVKKAATIYQWEAGLVQPKPCYRPLLADILGCTLDDIFAMFPVSPRKTLMPRRLKRRPSVTAA